MTAPEAGPSPDVDAPTEEATRTLPTWSGARHPELPYLRAAAASSGP